MRWRGEEGKQRGKNGRHDEKRKETRRTSKIILMLKSE